VEGTAACAAATLVSWGAVLIGAWACNRQYKWSLGLEGLNQGWVPAWVGVGVATVLASVHEAVTGQLDNLVVPLHYMALLCCV
jgi:hypothetical protein